MPHQDTYYSIAGGISAPFIGAKMGFVHQFKTIHWEQLPQVLLFAIIGSVVGFYTSKLLKFIHKQKK